MCGLVGCAGKILHKEEKAFKILLYLDTLRGEDSTGIAYIKNAEDEGTVIKLPVPAPDFINTLYYDKFDKAVKRVIIGHNRAATKGAVNKINSHPFEFDNIIGAHNGTLRYDATLKGGFPVDSQNLFHALDTQSPEEVIPEITGAWALTWWDRRNKTVNFLRNSERTLYYCFDKDKTCLFWASEEWMLEVALKRADIETEDIFLMKEDMWYSVAIDMVSPSHTMKPITVPKGVAVEGKKFQSTTNSVVFNNRPTITGEAASQTGFINLQEMTKRINTEVNVRVSSLVTDSGTKAALCFEVGSNVEFILFDSPCFNLSDLLGKRIKAKIKKLYCKNRKYKYHLSASSVEVVDNVIALPTKATPVDHRFLAVSQKEWDKRYSNCSMCTCDLEYGNFGKIISYDEILCESCAKANLARMI